ncbi:site-specific integrase [Methylorubrum populi]|nr:site-specific integrase [Methylorubrum populi]
MVLAMSRPHKRSKSGNFWLRKRVPKDVAALAGRTMEYYSLKTSDPDEAKRRYAEEIVKLEARWASLRAGPRQISEREAHELAASLYDDMLTHYRDYPSDQRLWSTDVGSDLWRAPEKPRGSVLERANKLLRGEYGDTRREDEREAKKDRLRKWCKQQADRLIQERGLVTDEAGRWELTRAVSAAMQRASLTLERMGRGEDVELSSAIQQDRPVPRPDTVKQSDPVDFGALFQAYAAERNLPPRTRYEWARTFEKLAASVGHKDAARLTTDELIKWKDAMVADGLAAKTIRDGYLAAVRAVLKWAMQNRRIVNNPADGVTVAVRKKAGQGIRGYTDQEASKLLSAAAQENDPVRRWIPLICCTTGARLNEVCQLRKEDVERIGTIWALHIRAEAGPIKNLNSERTIPIHSALISRGFLDYVELASPGPLFPSLKPDKFGKRGGTGTKQLGPWVRALGLDDPRLSPSHSWRHRFQTLARRYELKTDIANALTGHGPRSIADRYGETELLAMQREIEKISVFD